MKHWNDAIETHLRKVLSGVQIFYVNATDSARGMTVVILCDPCANILQTI